MPPNDKGPRPLDYLKNEDSSVLRVTRKKCNGVDEDEAGTGTCGIVPDVVEFEKEIQKKWGGGLYEVTGNYEGQMRTASVTIAGKSKPIHKDKEEEEEEEEIEIEEIEERPPFARRPVWRRPYEEAYDPPPVPGSFGARLDRDPYRDPYGRWYPRDPYGQGVAGPYPPPPPPPSWPYGGQPPYGAQPYGAPPPGYGPGYGPAGQWPQAPQPGAPPFFNPYGPAAPPGAPPPPAYTKISDPEKEKQIELLSKQSEALQKELNDMRVAAQEAADAAAQEREERRIDAERTAAREREGELKRELDQIRLESERRTEAIQIAANKRMEDLQQRLEMANQQHQNTIQNLMVQLNSNKEGAGSSAMNKMLEMQMLQLNQQGQRLEQERLEREVRWREEQSVRREEHDRREQEYKRERERQDELKREEREREEARRRDQEKQYHQAIQLMQKGQQTPEQMLAMLKTLIDIGGAKKDATSQVMELAQAAVAIRDMMGGNTEQENKWEGIIRTGGEALARAIGEIQARRSGEAQQQMPPQHPVMAAPQVTMQSMPAQPVYQQPAGPAPGPAYQHPELIDPNASEWGRILAFAIDAHDSGNDPETTATHLHTMVLIGMQRPKALSMLERTTAEELKFQVSMLGMSPDVARSPFKPKIDRLVALLDDPQGKMWIGSLIAHIAAIQQAVRESMNRAQGEEGEEEEEEEEEEGGAQAAPAQVMTSEQFAAQSRGVPLQPNPQEQYRNPPPGGTSEDFSRRSRGPEPQRPTGGWDKP